MIEFILKGQQIDKDFPVALSTSLPSLYRVLVEFKVVTDHKVVQQ